MTYTPGLWLFILSAFILAGLIGYSWRYRHEPTGREFLFLMCCALLWNMGFILETASLTLSQKLSFFPLQFIGITLLPVAWLYLVIAYIALPVSRRTRWALLVVPFLTNLVLWTNPLHHWFMGNPTLLQDLAPFPVVHADYQFWFYFVHVPYSYLLIILAIGLLVHYLFKVGPTFRVQGRLLLASIMLPSLVDVLYVLGVSPVRYYNFTTAVFSLSGLLLVWTLFRFHFLELLPLARDMVIENLSDGIIVFDHKHRVTEINAAARIFFQVQEDVIGQPMDASHNPYLQQIANILESKQIEANVEIGGPAGRIFEVRISPVRNIHSLRIGWVATSHDVTERVRLFRQVQSMSHQDSLTGIYNHRFFIEFASREVKHHQLFSVVMIDLDLFKEINDTYGHAVGDRVLIAFVNKIKAQLRKNDIFGRLGGEEFALLLCDVAARDAFSVVERLRISTKKIEVVEGGQRIGVTASFGFVSSDLLEKSDQNIEKMLKLADQALYRAKEQGRNRTQAY